MFASQLEKVPLCRFHYALLIVVGLAYTFVAMDVLLISLALPLLRAEWALPEWLTGFLAGSTFIGMLIGAVTWGYLADRIGRKKALELAMLTYTFFTGASALAWGWPSMILMRILTGVGLGGAIPLCFVFLSEFMPAKNRGRFLVILDSFWAYGWILAAMLGYLVIPKLGWKAFFLAGSSPVLALPLIHALLPESVRYLEEKGEREKAEKILNDIVRKCGATSEPLDGGGITSAYPKKFNFSDLWSKEFRKQTIFTWIMWFCMVYGYYSLTLWIVGFVQGMGYPLPAAMGLALLTSFAQLPGYFFSAWLIEAWGRKPTLVAFLTLSAISALGFGTASSYLETAAWLAAINFSLLGAWGVVMTYSAEVYPTKVRGTGYGSASGFGRFAGIIGPTVVGLLVQNYGLFSALFATATVLLAGAVSTALMGVETRGKTLEEITLGFGKKAFER
jgi:putative MFS transporter